MNQKKILKSIDYKRKIVNKKKHIKLQRSTASLNFRPTFI